MTRGQRFLFCCSCMGEGLRACVRVSFLKERAFKEPLSFISTLIAVDMRNR